jgi:plastocyanin
MLTRHIFALLSGNAPSAANMNLIAQILMGILLLIGMILARRGKFRAHGICQSFVMLINLIPIIAYMVPVFHRSVWSKFPAGVFARAFYAFPAAHAVVGLTAELLGLFIILRAGTNILPQALRFENYKLWMRSALALWWLSIALGVATYAVWHLSNAPTTGSASTRPAAPGSVTITMKNFVFEPAEVTVAPGTTVVWKGVEGQHTISSDDRKFESDILAANGEFSFKFEQEGRYLYFCALHGEPGGKKMAGTVIVSASAK